MRQFQLKYRKTSLKKVKFFPAGRSRRTKKARFPAGAGAGKTSGTSLIILIDSTRIYISELVKIYELRTVQCLQNNTVIYLVLVMRKSKEKVK